MFQIKFNLDLSETSIVIAIPFIVYIFLGPFIGILFDKLGQRCNVLIAGFVCLTISQYMFYSFDSCSASDKCYQGIYPMSMMGLALTFIQLTLYVSINYIVSEKRLGTAYGIIQSINNCGNIIGNLMIGDILDFETKETEAVNL